MRDSLLNKESAILRRTSVWYTHAQRTHAAMGEKRWTRMHSGRPCARCGAVAGWRHPTQSIDPTLLRICERINTEMISIRRSECIVYLEYLNCQIPLRFDLFENFYKMCRRWFRQARTDYITTWCARGVGD